MSGRPRRKAAMKQGHIESGGEQFHLDQVKQMKRGTLLKNFATFDSDAGTYHCRFQPNCSKTYQRGEMMSLSAHLLIHVRDATERSVKNPKFYENLIFHSVPKEKQFDIGDAFNEDGEKINPAEREDSSNQEIPWYFQQLKLTRRKKPEKEIVHTKTTEVPNTESYDAYREWKESFSIISCSNLLDKLRSSKVNVF